MKTFLRVAYLSCGLAALACSSGSGFSGKNNDKKTAAAPKKAADNDDEDDKTSGTATTKPKKKTVVPKAHTATESDPQILPVGSSKALADLLPANTKITKVQVSDPTVASVDPVTHEIKALKPGETEITIDTPDGTKTVYVKVVEPGSADDDSIETSPDVPDTDGSTTVPTDGSGQPTTVGDGTAPPTTSDLAVAVTDDEAEAALACGNDAVGGTCERSIGRLKYIKSFLAPTTEPCDPREVYANGNPPAHSAKFKGFAECPAGYTVLSAGADGEVAYGGELTSLTMTDTRADAVSCSSDGYAAYPQRPQNDHYQYIFLICIK